MGSQIDGMVARFRSKFEAERRVLRFDAFLNLFGANPRKHSRDAARYLKDCFDHFGHYIVQRPWGEIRRWAVFDDLDLPPQGSDVRRSRLVGHEDAQNAFYRVLSNFEREARANRLLLFHGPNGSAKSTFAACLMRALEVYSRLDEGAAYTFAWVFPRGQDGKTIGFDSNDRGGESGSFAELDDGSIGVQLRSELRESPLLLLPLNERREFIDKAYSQAGLELSPPQWLYDGELCHKNQQIFQALLQSYRGDLDKVFAHVRVERYQISRRYRVGAVTVGPQMSVDAHERQITADQTVASLPASLSSINLFETFGDLVDASGGVLQYSDLLKRPLDAWKYLLLAIEEGEVPLAMSNLVINSVFVGSSNELHLAAFREHPEYNSFRVRIEPIRMPYLLDYTQEEQIYETQIAPQLSCFIAPHAIRVAALWAVLSRLRRPQDARYPDPDLGKVAASLSPFEKADLYALGRIPERLNKNESVLLKKGIEAVWNESTSIVPYEGLTGASPRELRTLLLDAAQDSRFDHLSPLAVLDQIERLCIRGDHAFLKETAEHGYQDHRGFIGQVKKRWLEYVEDELRSCSGLVEETRYVELFDRYVTHVSNSIKHERVYNKTTGDYEKADEKLMQRVEETLEVGENKKEFRNNLISAVGAHGLDHPGEKMDYAKLFPEYIRKLRQSFYAQRQAQVIEIAQDVLTLLAAQKAPLEPERQKRAQTVLDALVERFSYTNSSLRAALGELVSTRL